MVDNFENFFVTEIGRNVLSTSCNHLPTSAKSSDQYAHKHHHILMPSFSRFNQIVDIAEFHGQLLSFQHLLVLSGDPILYYSNLHFTYISSISRNKKIYSLSRVSPGTTCESKGGFEERVTTS